MDTGSEFVRAWLDENPGREYVPQWTEPWIGKLWDELDLTAVLTDVGLPVAPIDPGELSEVQRDLLPEWAVDRAKRVREAQKKASEAAKQKRR